MTEVSEDTVVLLMKLASAGAILVAALVGLFVFVF